MQQVSQSIRGRGTAENPQNRFEKLRLEPDPDAPPVDPAIPETRYFRDLAGSIIAFNDSPDVGFSASLNPYRGCEHGCVYCYARPGHEYLGLSAGLDFETQIFVKENAPQLLRKALASPKWKPQVVALSGFTDCYQPVERRLRLTRGCLEVFAEFRNPVVIITKNALVSRDIDLLGELARHQCIAVNISLTTLNFELGRLLEPRTSQIDSRLGAMRDLAAAGIPVGALLAPMIPGLTDHEIPALLKAASEAGAKYAGYVPLRLPHGVKDLFEAWLERHFPLKKEGVLARIRSIRGGKLNDARYGHRMHGTGYYAEHMAQLFQVSCRKFGLAGPRPELSTAFFRRPGGVQMDLFGAP